MLQKILQNLYFIVRPRWWLMVGTYDERWDRKLNRLLDKYDFTEIGKHTAELNGREIWVSNYPYASMREHRGLYTSNLLPSRKTILRAYKKLIEDDLKQI
jgi:hypothetical protein